MSATATKTRKAKINGISLSTAALRAAVSAVKAAVPTRSPKPILQNVLLADGTITATDLELLISAELEYIGAPLLLPFARLDAILRAAVGDEVTIEATGSSAIVRIGHGEWTLPTEDAAEFPRWEPTGLKPICRVPADQFCRAARAVSYATDDESSRFALGSVLVEMADGVATWVATDGRRLASYRIEIDQDTDNWVNEPKGSDKKAPLVPTRAIDAMSHAAHGSTEAIQLEANGSEVYATIGGATIAARCIEGRFPRWRDVFPDREISPTVVNATELLAATRQAAIVTSEQSKGVTFAITKEGIHLTARSSEVGESSVTCPVLEFGNESVVSLDPRFVSDFLRSIDQDEPVHIEAAGTGDAVVLWTGDDQDCKCVIMPLAAD